MGGEGADTAAERTQITVRYWAAARSAADTDADTLGDLTGPVTLAEVLTRIRALHAGERFAAVLAICSVMVDDRPVTTADPSDVLVLPGQSVEVLPPFAGG